MTRATGSNQSAPAPAIPPGWHPDPMQRHEFRYWNGTSWTSSVSDAGVQSEDLVVQGGATERVQAIIPRTTLKSGFMGVKSRRYTLILTDQRVIFARRTRAGMKQRVTDAREGQRSAGAGSLGQVAATMDAFLGWDEKRYLTMPPDQALVETAANFAVERSAITKTSLKTRRIRERGSEGGGTYVEYHQLLVIKTPGKKYEITLGSGRGQAGQALRAAGMIKRWQF